MNKKIKEAETQEKILKMSHASQSIEDESRLGISKDNAPVEKKKSKAKIIFHQETKQNELESESLDFLKQNLGIVRKYKSIYKSKIRDLLQKKFHELGRKQEKNISKEGKISDFNQRLRGNNFLIIYRILEVGI